MYQSKSRRYGAAMVALSLCLRLCIYLGLDAKAAAVLSQAARQTPFAAFMLYLETGQVSRAQETQGPVYVLEMELAGDDAAPDAEAPVDAQADAPADPPAETEPDTTQAPAQEAAPAEAELPASLASASAIAIAGGCTYQVDKAALLAQPSTLDFSVEGPTILIVHTHASESYTAEAGYEYDESGAYRTLDPTRSVIAVGEALAQRLRSYGLEVLHDETFHDYPSYNDSYANALVTIESYLEQYPSIQMVIDVHRDAVADESGAALPLSATVDGEKCAQLMLVVGTDQGGLNHPGWRENLANALKLQSVLQGAYPGLCRNLNLRTERFNQHMTPGSILVEVGSNGNTLSQALTAAEHLGDALAAMIAALPDNPWGG